jgi:hypothetical protein
MNFSGVKNLRNLAYGCIFLSDWSWKHGKFFGIHAFDRLINIIVIYYTKFCFNDYYEGLPNVFS